MTTEFAWRRRLAPAVLLVLLALLAACGGGEISVARTSAFRGTSTKATFFMLATEAQEGDATYEKYADQIAKLISQPGFVRVTKAGQARYAVMFSYNEGELDAQAKAAEKRRKKGGKDTHKESEADTAERTLSIAIFDLTMPNSKGEKVFGAYVHCPRPEEGGTVTPFLIDAALKDFPGRDGHETYSEGLPFLE